MGDLTTCPSCDRHVRASETTCPFCKGKVVARQVGGVLAAAVGATLLTGCPRQPAPVYGGPPPRPVKPAPPQPAPPQPGPSQAEPSDSPEASMAPAPSPEERPVAPAYGAPAPQDSPVLDEEIEPR